MSVVNLFGTAPGVASPDMGDIDVMGSEGELNSMQKEGNKKTEHPSSQKNALGESM